jgi:hypothetical protein
MDRADISNVAVELLFRRFLGMNKLFKKIIVNLTILK